MILRILMPLLAVMILSGCADHWSQTAPDGSRFEDVAPACRAKAHESAKRQLPFAYDWQQGPADFPPDSRRDIEDRETALCLQQRGFRLTRD